MTLRWLIAACIVVAAQASPALAQYGSMSMGLYGEESSFRPDLSQRDLRVIVRVLHLQADAETALMNLYAGYAGTLESEGADVKEFVNGHIEKAEIMQDPALLAPAQKRLGEWSTRSEQVKKTFLADLKSLLTTDQESRWPIVERELRRMKFIGKGRLAGESIDLVRLTEEVLGGPAPSQELADLLNRYSDDLDHALVARAAVLEEKQKDYSDKLKADPKGAEAAWVDAQKARVAVRDVNDRYVRLVAAQLPAGKAAELNRLYFEQSYRAIMKPTRMDAYIKDVAELKTLSPGQKGRFEDIKAKYESDKHAIIERQAKTWREFELEFRPEGLAEALGERRPGADQQKYNGSWLPDAHPLVQARKDRFELDKETRKTLDSMLSPEQRTAIPSRLTPNAQFDNWMPWGL